MHSGKALRLPLCLVSSAQKPSHQNSFQAVIIFSDELILYSLNSLPLNHDEELRGKRWLTKKNFKKEPPAVNVQQEENFLHSLHSHHIAKKTKRSS